MRTIEEIDKDITENAEQLRLLHEERQGATCGMGVKTQVYELLEGVRDHELYLHAILLAQGGEIEISSDAYGAAITDIIEKGWAKIKRTPQDTGFFEGCPDVTLSIAHPYYAGLFT